MKDIKLVLTDIDGTLLSPNLMPLQSSYEIIDKIREKGIKFGLVTGRDFDSVNSFLLDRWKLRGKLDVFIGENGSFVKDFSSNKISKQFYMSSSELKQVYNHFKDLEVSMAVSEKGYLHVDKINEQAEYFSDMVKIPIKVVDFDTYLQQPKPKIHIGVLPKDMQKVIDRAKTFHNPNLVGMTTSKYLFEYNNKNVNKKVGIQKLCQIIGIDKSQIIAFGDQMNDYEMLQYAGVSVAMGNALDEVKSQSKFITDGNDEDGIANFLKKYLEI